MCRPCRAACSLPRHGRWRGLVPPMLLLPPWHNLLLPRTHERLTSLSTGTISCSSRGAVVRLPPERLGAVRTAALSKSVQPQGRFREWGHVDRIPAQTLHASFARHTHFSTIGTTVPIPDDEHDRDTRYNTTRDSVSWHAACRTVQCRTPFPFSASIACLP